MKINLTKNEINTLNKICNSMPSGLLGSPYVEPGYVLNIINNLKNQNYNKNLLNELKDKVECHQNPKYGIGNVFNFRFYKILNAIVDQGFTNLEKYIVAQLYCESTTFENLSYALYAEEFEELEAAFYEDKRNEVLFEILKGLEKANIIKFENNIYYIV